MFDFIKYIFDFLLNLVNSHNKAALVVFTVLLVLFFAALLYIFWVFLKSDTFDRDFPLFFLRVRVYGGQGLRLGKRRYRKVLYIKVLCLSDRRSAATPFYQRTVPRMDEPAQQVPVFDEAVYYTLKLFPDDRPISREQDHSTGIVDPRVVIPWDIDSDQNRDTLGAAPQLAQMETSTQTDTMLSVSHFLNGMQSRDQKFCTYADEDTESLRLVVDFSSVPHAADFIKVKPAHLWFKNQIVQTDNVSYQDCGRSIYMAHCRDAKQGSTLRMDFTFNTWPEDTTAKPVSDSPCD
jgi:hypothetical protein